MKVTVIGLGAMGMGMALSALRGGHETTGFDIAEAARTRFTEAGGKTAASPAEAVAEAEVVFCVVVNAAQMESVLFGEGGVAAALRPGTVFAACPTVDPAVARATAARIEEAGALYLDAPISGGAVKAAEGKLTIMASGSAAAFEAAQPALGSVAETVFRLGDTAGPGSAMKMINQLLAGVHIAAAAEAMALAARSGLDLKQTYEVITKAAGNSWMFENRVPHIIEGDYSPRSAVEIFVKDLGIVLGAGHAERFPLPLSAAAHQLYLAAAGAGHGREDDSAVIKVYQKLSGISLPGDRA
ncbi:NAD(P)-dependent oxidoreductase (plasmid) [Paroceanicella profunda]|uniref:L-threonate dehydrogenase n=1 Tax=Paroceanicella profunda TaxID=2579971 RepID=A0A5B8FZA6_9RHOB|nr:L-threonate dehydrogenase [Paroceanicella profunda]QDL94246.1 NAD(P)-dependent oxidoreductase [Paroceanicella profunda]